MTLAHTASQERGFKPARRLCLSLPLWLGLACFMAAPAGAQNNAPDKPIRFIVPYTPGGGTDTVTRQLAEKITQETQWAFLIDNKPGAGGNIGIDLVAKAKPDGFTIGMGQTSNLAINPAAMGKLPFDASKDLVPVALVAAVGDDAGGRMLLEQAASVSAMTAAEVRRIMFFLWQKEDGPHARHAARPLFYAMPMRACTKSLRR